MPPTPNGVPSHVLGNELDKALVERFRQLPRREDFSCQITEIMLERVPHGLVELVRRPSIPGDLAFFMELRVAKNSSFEKSLSNLTQSSLEILCGMTLQQVFLTTPHDLSKHMERKYIENAT